MNKGYRMKFSDSLQNLRKQHNISQEQLAEQINVSRQSISKWENGDSYPETEKLIALCEIFNCSLDDLVRGEIKPSAASTSSTNSASVLQQYDQLMNKFTTGIAVGVVLLILGAAALIAVQDMAISATSMPAAIFMLFASIAVPIFIFVGIRRGKYNLDEYNQANTPTEHKNEALISKICGVIMLTATIIFFCLGFIGQLWEICWIVFPIGGMLCAIVSTILGPNPHS